MQKQFFKGSAFFLTLYGLLTLGLTGYQWLSSAIEARLFPAPGRLVELDGFRIHIDCSGPQTSGQPTVVLEGGLGAPGFFWTLVQKEAGNRYRVCSYDRAGYGWSDAGPAPRTADQIASELHLLLERAGEKPPYLLVAHSLGSLLARVYASTYPDEVSGLLLIDPRHEDFFERMPPESLVVDERNYRNARWLTWLTPLGYTRLLGNLGQLPELKAHLAPLPDDVEAAAWARMVNSPSHWQTSLTERDASPEIYAQARASRLRPGLPLLVLIAENGWRAWRTGDENRDELGHKTWLELQKEQSQLTAVGTWRIVPESGHYLYYEQPALIVEIIAEMLD